MKWINFLLSIALVFGIISCSNEDQLPDKENIVSKPNSNVVNDSGETAGMAYQLDNLTIDPKIAFIDETNAFLVSTENDLKDGKVILSDVSDGVTEKLVAGNSMYIDQGEYLSIRKIQSVQQQGSSYILQTTEGTLNDVFSDGKIQFSVDTEKAKKAFTRAGSEESNINISTEFKLDDNLTCKLNAKLTPKFDVTISFKDGTRGFEEISITCGLNPVIDARFISTGPVQKIYNKDFGETISEQIRKLIKDYKFEYVIPVSGLIKVPVKIGLDEIKLPVYVNANLLGDTDVAFSFGGTFNAKFLYLSANSSNNGFKLNDIDIKSETPNIDNLNGELATKLEVVIIPDIKVLNNLITANGDITIGLYTESANFLGTNNEQIKGSTGEFIAKGDVNVKVPLTGKIPFSLINDRRELWNLGSAKSERNELTLSSLSSNVMDDYKETFRTVRRYTTDFIVNYSYAMKGKQIPSSIDITYEVPTLLGSWDKKSETVAVKNVSDNNFTFTVEIPFYWKNTSLLRGEFKKESKIRNLVVNDKAECEYKLAEEFEVKRE